MSLIEKEIERRRKLRELRGRRTEMMAAAGDAAIDGTALAILNIRIRMLQRGALWRRLGERLKAGASW
jgi:soluble P-type ATPase